jgi:HlyD family secretion protein
VAVKNKVIVVSIAIVILILGSIVIFSGAKPKPKYELQKIEKRSITQTVEASGTVNPVKTVSIGSQVSGMIKSLYVDYNSNVKQGQLLAEIDPSLFQAQVDQARANVASASANYQKIKSLVAYDKANYARYKSMYAKRYVSKNDLDLLEATYRQDSANLNAMAASIAQNKATLRNNLTNLRYTKIISPVNGVVVSRAVDVGQTVAASFQTPTLFTVAQDLTKMQIEVSVSEADIGRVRQGQNVEYSLDGYPNDTFYGKVTQVRISPTTVSNVVTYTVIVSVDNDDGKLKPGMTANVSIITDKKEDALCVDNAALIYTPKAITGGKKYKEQGIWVLRENKPVRIKIKTGLADSDSTEVISNELREGDEVIIGDLGKKHTNMTQSGPPRMF